MKKNVQNAFSLMEMMVVLLIVAIIAAATAPMVTKKMARSVGSGDSPWVFTGLNNNIAYNLGGANASAIIGASNYSYGDNQPKYPRLVLAAGEDSDHPTLVFAGSEGRYSGQIDMNPTTNVVTMSGGNGTVEKNSVAIGMEQTIGGAKRTGIVAIGHKINTNGVNAIAIGQDTTAQVNSIGLGVGTLSTGSQSIAIGNRSQATALGTIAIGCPAWASGDDSIAIGQAQTDNQNSIAIGNQVSTNNENSVAIGYQASAYKENSVAIGSGAKATTDHQIVLGTANDTVYIPGHLVVRGDVALGSYPHSVYISTNGRNAGQFFCAKYMSDDKKLKTDTWYDSVRVGGQTYSKSSSSYFYSDRRLKNVGEKYTAGLEELKKLDFYHYTFKADKDNTPFVGVIAQDLQKVFPDAVTKDESGYLRIRIEDMFYAVINAVKELDTKISEIVTNITDIKATIQSQQDAIDILKKENSELQKQNAELQDEIKDIEKRIKKLEK